jgi:hypothetical protein
MYNLQTLLTCIKNEIKKEEDWNIMIKKKNSWFQSQFTIDIFDTFNIEL